MKSREFYVMLADPPWAGPTATVINGPNIMVFNGAPIRDIDERFEILLSVDSKAPDRLDFPPLDIHGPNRTLLFSQNFIEVLEQLKVSNIQYFDAAVTYEPTGAKVFYKVANVIGLVEGLDREKSDLILTPKGNVLEIERMCLAEERLVGQKIFRLQEDSMLVIVHKSIKEAVEQAGLKGFMFVTDEEYGPGMI